MYKEAQKRGLIDSIKEKADIFGRGAEALSPTFSALMEKLRETDDKIRESLLNEDVKLKEVLKSARQNFNRREYMQAVADIASFHEKMEEVINELKVLEFDVDAAHHEFLGNDLPIETIEKLRKTHERIKSKKDKKAAQKVWIKKQAGLSDLWYVLTSDRGKALRAWEKRYPSKMRQLKSQTATLLNKSDSLFSTLLSSLKEMSSGRASRNLDKYLKGAKKVIDSFNSYDAQYDKYYQDNVDSFLSKLVEKEKAAALLKEENGGKIESEELRESKVVETEDTGIGDKEVVEPDNAVVPDLDMDPRSQVPPSSHRQPTPASVIPSSVLPAPEYVPDTEVDSKPPSHHSEILSPTIPHTPTLPSKTHQLVSSHPSSKEDARQSIIDMYKMVQQKGSLHKNEVLKDMVETVRPGKINLPADTTPESLPPDTTPESSPAGAPTESSPSTVKDKKANKFISMLESLSSESPEMMALEINKFAKSISKTDPQVSKKLFAIVGVILDGK